MEQVKSQDAAAAIAERAGCDEEELGRVAQRVARLYRLWLALVLALLAVGTVLDLVEDGKMKTETVSLTQLPAALADADPAAFESLALLTVALGPVLGVAFVLVACARRGDRRTVTLAAIVLLIVAALPITRSIRGS